MTADADATTDGHQASDDVIALLLDYLDDVAVRTAERIKPIGGVAVTLEAATRPLTIGSSNRLAYDVDQVQYAIGQGPCLDALRTGVALYVPDLGADDRWGDYGPRAASLGAACCVSIPVQVAGRTDAVLKAYAEQVDGISGAQRDVLSDVAVEISGGIALARRLARQARELEDRVAAMDTRRVIDLALGMLMERTSCDATSAFALLRRYSQHYNVKLRDVARQIVGAQSGDVPGVEHAPFNAPAEY